MGIYRTSEYITIGNQRAKTNNRQSFQKITLNVESDGTVAGQQNLDVISDMLTDKIDKILGDKING